MEQYLLKDLLDELKSISSGQAEIRRDICEMKKDICEIQADMCEMKKDICELQEDICGLQEDVCEMKKDICEMKEDVSDLKTRVTNLELIQENIEMPKIQLIAEGHVALHKKMEELTELKSLKEDVFHLKSSVIYLSEQIHELQENACNA